MPDEIEGTSTEVTQPVTETGTESVGDIRTHPAWSTVLDKLPAQFQQLITPALQEWDNNFQKVQTAYAPFKQLGDVKPETLQEALNLHNFALNNPRGLYDHMGKTFAEEWGLTTPQSQQEPLSSTDQGLSEIDISDAPDTTSVENHPKYQELKSQLDVIATYLAGDLEKQQQQNVEAQLDREMEAIKSAHGDSFTDSAEQMIYTIAAGRGIDLNKAAELYFQSFGAPQQQVQKPSILPTSGGLPASSFDVSKLDGKDARGLALSYLTQLQRGA